MTIVLILICIIIIKLFLLLISTCVSNFYIFDNFFNTNTFTIVIILFFFYIYIYFFFKSILFPILKNNFLLKNINNPL